MSKSARHVYKEEGADTSKYARKKSLSHLFCNIYICKVLYHTLLSLATTVNIVL